MYERAYTNIVDKTGVCHLSNFNFRSFIMVSENAPTWGGVVIRYSTQSWVSGEIFYKSQTRFD